jgi:hypothetical protein
MIRIDVPSLTLDVTPAATASAANGSRNETE